MENAYFIFAREALSIERFHLCTWDLKKDSALIEFGIELNFECLKNDTEDIYISTPYLDDKCSIKCLYKQIKDTDTSTFIFNDTISHVEHLNTEDDHDGIKLAFAERGDLVIIPCIGTIDLDNKILKLTIKIPKDISCNVYFRILLETEYPSLAILDKDITKRTYTYDMRVNEKRNLSSMISNFKKDNSLNFCEIKSFFCFHIYPSRFSIIYINESKLKSIRKLETMAFRKYLPEIKSLTENKYSIIFNKDSDKLSYSSFTVFSKECIGYVQVLVAIVINIACSLFFLILK